MHLQVRASRFRSVHDTYSVSDDNHEPTQNRQKRVVAEDSPWAPWPDRVTCGLHVISRLPRSQFSSNDMDVVSWLLRFNGVQDVPSTAQLKSARRVVEEGIGIEIKKHVGALGHTYYVLKPSSHVQLDFANPLVRPHLHFYPEDVSPRLDQTRQAAHWRHEADPDLLTQMWRNERGIDFYVFEPCMLDDGVVCMPHRFFSRAGAIWFEAWGMSCKTEADGWVVEQWRALEFPAARMLGSGQDLLAGLSAGPGLPYATNIVGCSLAADADHLCAWAREPINPWRRRACGARCVSYRSWLYCDDTSGNRSKKWNEHNSYLMVAAGLDGEHAHRESNVHFLCTSNAAPPLEMLDGIMEDIEESQARGIWVWDWRYDEMVLVIIVVHALLGDNPMQSEFSCHGGLRSKFFCRICMVKGKDAAEANADAEELMIDRITRFMTIGEPRDPRRTQEVLETMLQNTAASQPLQANKDLQATTGIKDRLLTFFLEKTEKARKKLTGEAAFAATLRALDRIPRNPFNPVWRIKGLNPHAHTPVEILHVVLLGFIKYHWRDAISRLSDEQKDILKARLASLDIAGLDEAITALRGHTFVQYSGSLVGRDFRVLSQIAIFAMYDMLDNDILEAWAALCALVPLVWMPRIDNLEEYLHRLQSAIDHFLNCTAKWTPRWFNKPKYHLLLHLVEHIRLFGPSVLFATEVFESYNAVIRAWSIFSNRLSPSRDIALAAAGTCQIRHLLCGGYYPTKVVRDNGTVSTQWVRAGKSVREIGKIPSVITDKLGIARPDAKSAQVGLCAGISNEWMWWPQSRAASHGFSNPFSGGSSYQMARSIIADNGDRVFAEGFAISCMNGLANVVRVHQIYVAKDSRLDEDDCSRRIFLERYECGEMASPYRMPRLHSTGQFWLAKPHVLMCAVNVQHNCAANKCDLSARKLVYLEREFMEYAPATRHYNEHDIILNTAKMRDGRWILLFSLVPAPLDRATVVREAVAKELML
ncbi:hypothetical protein K523DRAFT_385050 [Schizophyllum commune Tattone D]|nr:hypothetical protein K523DRAFT_385050 [Schizophyllum commune Tattone D]